eukprot:CAMPEP_0170456206 /NCGR_PEP_ID=MMETSP0123-20130129/3919_1 /TAXON_ID=182087 /ORGANISM="Favella ehrenbergii, Strain Fehren 1" /LENGTH=166 /DNA_ID=CAMNT_0010719609 /DNA_START=270 /DNA_END=770 /DNA_ORIENTATION=+
MAALSMGTLNIVGSASIIDVNPESSTFLQETKIEKNLVEVEQDPTGSRIQMDTDKIKFDFHRKDSTSYLKQADSSPSFINIDASGIDLKFAGLFDGSHESNYWATPLTEDKLTTFVTWKRAGIPLKSCEYTFGGQSFSLGEGECSLTTDMYRGHHNYGMAFYFGLV